MEDLGAVSLIPTIVVFVLAILTHRPIESLISGSIVGLIIIHGAQFIGGFAETSVRAIVCARANPTLSWVSVSCVKLFGKFGRQMRVREQRIFILIRRWKYRCYRFPGHD